MSGSIHQPANPAPDPSVRSHERVQSFRTVAWVEAGRWRVGKVGYADRNKAEVFPVDGGHVLVWLGVELDGLRVRPLPLKRTRHEV